MSTGALQPRKETLLIYLPCYLDFQLALDQAKRIREIERNHTSKIPLEIEIMISCNGLEFSMIEKQEFSRNCNHVILFPFGISGDINITQGFMHAIRLEADYLWILSSNDAVSDKFIETITENLIASGGVDILVGCASENLGLRSVHSVFDPTNRDVPFGLISSVVYRIKNMDKNFDSGVQMNWTGWGQLAVIEASCIALTQLNVSLVRESDLYLRSTRSLENQIDEERRIRNGYAHSFFGMPIVISTLHADNPRMRKKYLNGWITSNWYLVNYFLRTDYKLWSSHIASNQIWLRQFAFAAIRNASVMHRIIFKLSKFVNLSALRRYRAAQIIRRMFKS